jgi:hypothetical protein
MDTYLTGGQSGMRLSYGYLATGILALLPTAAKQYILRSELMKKAIIRIGYYDYVLDTPKAIALLELLEETEMYESKYHTTDGGVSTHHIYKRETEDGTRPLRLLTKSFYDMAKLAGKPENN